MQARECARVEREEELLRSKVALREAEMEGPIGEEDVEEESTAEVVPE